MFREVLCMKYIFIISSYCEYNLQMIIYSQTGKGVVKVKNTWNTLKRKVVLNGFIFKMGEYFNDPTVNQGKQLNTYEQM